MQNLLRRFAQDTRGNFAIMGAGCMVLVIGCAALGVDVGSIYADRRKSQSAADLAAIVAASNLGNATNAAAGDRDGNGYPASALVSVELGSYTANAALAPQARFVTPAASTANAARVTLRTQTPLYFARMFTGGKDHFNINSTAMAASTAVASFAIGSRLAVAQRRAAQCDARRHARDDVIAVGDGLSALTRARIDAFDFLSALATRVNLTGVTYSDVLSSNIKLPDIVAAMLTAQQAANGSRQRDHGAVATFRWRWRVLTTKISAGSLIDRGALRKHGRRHRNRKSGSACRCSTCCRLRERWLTVLTRSRRRSISDCRASPAYR